MNQTKVSRRQFIKMVAGATVVAGGGLAYLAVRQPEIDFATAACAATSSGKKVLVAYASQYGSTSEVAAAIGEVFCGDGTAVDVLSIANVPDVAGYDAVVLGAPIQSEAWKPDAVTFVQTHAAALSRIPTAFFTTSMTLGLAGNRPEIRQQIDGHLDAVRAQFPAVQPVDVGHFAGALDYSKMSFAMAQLYRAFAEDDTDGDYRDWNAIRSWATAVQPKLSSV
jgi:menaquinone-dependent protoporphyrinogen oxidase